MDIVEVMKAARKCLGDDLGVSAVINMLDTAIAREEAPTATSFCREGSHCTCVLEERCDNWIVQNPPY
jgi:hypothetical protein